MDCSADKRGFFVDFHILYPVFCILCSFFILALRADTSIIDHRGFDSFEAATSLFVIS
jgi:hypothetical protein